MKFGFFYDGPVTKNSKNQYFGTAITDEMFSKYFYVADELAVCIRVKLNEDTKGLKEVKDPRLTFVDCVNLSSLKGMFKRTQAKETIRNTLADCEGAFIRLPSRIGIVAIECCKEMDKPYLVEVVGCIWDTMWNHSLKGKIMALPMFWETKNAIKNSPAVIYVTNRFLQKRYPTKGMAIACSDVNIKACEKYVLKNRQSQIHRKYETSDKLIIGTIGAVHVRFKGQERIICALGELKKKGYTNYEYHLVGGGKQDYLRKIAQENGVEEQVKFMGPLPHGQVMNWLNTIDLYAQPSQTEGMPRALLEAMSLGVPAIGTNVGGISELLDADCLFANNKHSVKEIQRMLMTLNSEAMCKQAERNFNIAREYEYDVLDVRRQEFYRKVLKKS